MHSSKFPIGYKYFVCASVFLPLSLASALANPDVRIRIEGAGTVTGNPDAGHLTSFLNAVGVSYFSETIPIAIEIEIDSSVLPAPPGTPVYTPGNCYTITQLCFDYSTAVASIKYSVGNLSWSTDDYIWQDAGGFPIGISGGRGDHLLRGVFYPQSATSGTAPVITGVGIVGNELVQHSYYAAAAVWSIQDPACSGNCSSWLWSGADSWLSLGASPSVSLGAVFADVVNGGSNLGVSIGCSGCQLATITVAYISSVPKLSSLAMHICGIFWLLGAYIAHRKPN